MAAAGLLGMASPATPDAAADFIRVDGICIPQQTATVTSPVQEIIDEMIVDEGAFVRQGEVLARLRSRLQEIAVERTSRILEKKEFDFNAAQSLSADRIVSRERALNAEIDLALAKVDHEEATHLLEERTIIAPFDGFILRRYKEQGESIDRMEPLYALVNIDVLDLQVFVEPRLAASLTVGQEVNFTAEAADGEPLAATVEFISPSADPSSGLVRVTLRHINEGHLVRAGTRITALFPAP